MGQRRSESQGVTLRASQGGAGVSSWRTLKGEKTHRTILVNYLKDAQDNLNRGGEKGSLLTGKQNSNK